MASPTSVAVLCVEGKALVTDRVPVALTKALQRARLAAKPIATAEDVLGAELLVVASREYVDVVAEALHHAGVFSALRRRLSSGDATLLVGSALALLATRDATTPTAQLLELVPATLTPTSASVGADAASASALDDGATSASAAGAVPCLTHGFHHVQGDPGAAVIRADGLAVFRMVPPAPVLLSAPLGWKASVAWTGQQSRTAFVCALERGRVVGCAYHPELSAGFGTTIIKRWARPPISVPASTPTPATRQLLQMLRVDATGTLSDQPLDGHGVDGIVLLGSTGVDGAALHQALAHLAESASVPIYVGPVSDTATAEKLCQLASCCLTPAASVTEGWDVLFRIGLAAPLVQAASDFALLQDPTKYTGGVFVLQELVNDAPAAMTSSLCVIVGEAIDSSRKTWPAATENAQAVVVEAVQASAKEALFYGEAGNVCLSKPGPTHDSLNNQSVVPEIRLQGGVAFVGAAQEPMPLTQAVTKLSVFGEVIIIDHDGPESLPMLAEAYKIGRCRVGGLVTQDPDVLVDMLNDGAASVILDNPDDHLPRDRVVVRRQLVEVDRVWLTEQGVPFVDDVKGLADKCTAVQVVFLGPDGKGTVAPDVAFLSSCFKQLKGTKVQLIIEGVVSAPMVRHLDRIGIESQVFASEALSLAAAVAAPIISDRSDGLLCTVVCDERGVTLGFVYSSAESIAAAIDHGRGVYQSRSRGLWFKGDTSGAHQDLLQIKYDCDRDCLLFVVRQHGQGFCHRNQHTCFGPARGLGKLLSTLQDRLANAPEGSYTKRLFDDEKLLNSKIIEEAIELTEAESQRHIAEEAADVLYFAMTRCVKAGVDLKAIEGVLDERGLKVKRRPGNAKPDFIKKHVQG
eukprot:m.146879 g.146879  ORF g.146879 m.146879 type:complete len:860 (+) comp17268_c0_seq3:32-2611(+)